MSDFNRYLISLMQRVKNGDHQALQAFAIIAGAEGQKLLTQGLPNDVWATRSKFWIFDICLEARASGFSIPEDPAGWIQARWDIIWHSWISEVQEVHRDHEAGVDFQRRMQSASCFRWHDLEIGAAFRPAAGLSGDLYHHSETSGGYTVALLDSMGHGSRAGLHAVHTLGLLRAFLHEPVSSLLKRLNESMNRYKVDNEYASLIVARFQSSSHLVQIGNAGGVPPVLFGGEKPKIINEGSHAPGMLAFHPGIETTETLPPGGTLMILSDWFCPDFNPEEAIAAAQPILDQTPERIARTLVETVPMNMSGLEPDDRTALIVKRDALG